MRLSRRGSAPTVIRSSGPATSASAPTWRHVRGVEVLERRDGTLMVLAPDKWRITVMERDHPELTLETLLAG